MDDAQTRLERIIGALQSRADTLRRDLSRMSASNFDKHFQPVYLYTGETRLAMQDELHRTEALLAVAA